MKSTRDIGRKDYKLRNKCKTCKKIITDDATHCKSCRQLGKMNSKYNPQKHINNYCIDCGKEIKLYFSKRCNSCENKRRHLVGILNSYLSNYKDGRTKLRTRIWNSAKNKQLRFEIFKRDNYKCVVCHKKRNIYLNAHHKIPVSYILDLYNIKTFKQALKCKLLWDINWQITLCEQCHGELNEGKK